MQADADTGAVEQLDEEDLVHFDLGGGIPDNVPVVTDRFFSGKATMRSDGVPFMAFYVITGKPVREVEHKRRLPNGHTLVEKERWYRKDQVECMYLDVRACRAFKMIADKEAQWVINHG